MEDQTTTTPSHDEAVEQLMRAQIDIVMQIVMSGETDLPRAVARARARIDQLEAAVHTEHGQDAEMIISEARRRLDGLQPLFDAWAVNA